MGLGIHLRALLPALGGTRLGLPLKQQGQRLQRFAEAHVVRQAAPQPQPRQEPQPVHSHRLVRAQLRLQPGNLRASAQARRLTQLRQHPLQPFARLDARPLALHSLRQTFLGAGCPGLEPGDHPHPLEERHPATPRQRLHLLPMRQRLPHLLRINLHPFAAHQRQAVGRVEQRLPFRFRQRLPIQRPLHGEIQQRVRPRPALRLSPTRTLTRGRGGRPLSTNPAAAPPPPPPRTRARPLRNR